MTSLGPITISVMEGGVPGGFVGQLEISGDIDRLVVAGQELSMMFASSTPWRPQSSPVTLMVTAK